MEQNNFKFLGKLNFPEDIKKISKKNLPLLADEIRATIINTVSKNGGHLSSNLGVVELSIALHRVFDSPKDKFVWDVGHQIYAHKILTGRFDSFDTLRKENGISGFSAPNESEHDPFYSGHSSTSISAALGIAAANKQFGKDDYTVAVIGDGALTGGMAYEALNNAGRSETRLIVILNDNEMSISENVGSMARYLAVIRSMPEYYRVKARTETVLNHIPIVGKKISKEIFELKTSLKNRIYKSTFFEELGFRYMGPIDGNNIEILTEALESAKMLKRPVLLHINTIKGKGYQYAENSPSTYHGLSGFNVMTGKVPAGSPNFSAEFGKALCSLAEKDNRISAITAAMALGTGLKEFSERFPDRFFDVGIAEEHAVTFASGLAKGGAIPVIAVYSTFLQRAYDQLIHDGTLQKQKIIIGLDRAGFVGDDGVTHQGLLDIPYLNTIPNVVVYSPFTFERLNTDLKSAVESAENLTIIRYPRGGEALLPEKWIISDNDFDLHFGSENNLIVTYGRLTGEAAIAYDILNTNNIGVSVLTLNKIKPIPAEAVAAAEKYKNIFFFEEAMRSGGIGESFADKLLEAGYKGCYKHIAVNDEFVAHASIESLMHKYLLDSDSMVKIISEKTNG